MTKSDFVWKIEHGDDIMFDVFGKHYTILTWPENGIIIGEQNVDDDGVCFESAEELLDGFTVDGSPLSSIISNVNITNYTLVRE